MYVPLFRYFRQEETKQLHLISIVIYRIAFHPLAKYPGPFLAKITNFRAAYHAWVGDLHLDVTHCHEQYGQCIETFRQRLRLMIDFL